MDKLHLIFDVYGVMDADIFNIERYLFGTIVEEDLIFLKGIKKFLTVDKHLLHFYIHDGFISIVADNEAKDTHYPNVFIDIYCSEDTVTRLVNFVDKLNPRYYTVKKG